MSFLSDVADALTGKGKRDLYEQQLANQLAAIQSEQDFQAELARLKYNPERIKQQKYIILGVLLIVGAAIIAYIYMKGR